MELYRIWYKTAEACLPVYILSTNPIEAQRGFYINNPKRDIVDIEHIGKKVNTKCKIRNKEDLMEGING